MPSQLGLVALLLVLVAACSGSNRPAPAVQLISALEAEQLIADNQTNPGFVILDVRRPGEFALGHLDGAVNIDYLDAGFANAVDALDRSRTYLVYCAAGGRSAQACDQMFAAGFVVLYDMDGGFGAWDAAGLPWTN